MAVLETDVVVEGGGDAHEREVVHFTSSYILSYHLTGVLRERLKAYGEGGDSCVVRFRVLASRSA